MRGSGILALLGAVVGALIIADLWRNASVTNHLITAGMNESRLIAGRNG